MLVPLRPRLLLYERRPACEIRKARGDASGREPRVSMPVARLSQDRGYHKEKGRYLYRDIHVDSFVATRRSLYEIGNGEKEMICLS
jgi:hypothetical protein